MDDFVVNLCLSDLVEPEQAQLDGAEGKPEDGETQETQEGTEPEHVDANTEPAETTDDADGMMDR